MQESKNSKKRIVSGAGVLAIGGIVAKMLGALYRIPLTNVLGAEGMGMYQLVFPVYALFMVLSTLGIPTALSRIIAEKRVLGEPYKKYFASGMLALFLLGTFFCALVFALAKPLANWQGNQSTYIGFVVIAPAIPLVAIISGFRGFFQGQMNMLPTAISNVVEQIVKLAVGIALAVALSKRGVTYAVCGALLGVAVSELVTVVYMFATYLYHARKGVCAKEKICKITKEERASMLHIALPIAAVSVLMPLTNFFDSVIVVNMLKAHGIQESVATAQYGLASGPVNSLINVPVVAIMSLAVAIVPSVSASKATRDVEGVMLKSRLCVRVAYFVGIPFAFFFMIFAKSIISTIYPTLSQSSLIVATNVLRITAINVVSLSVMQIYFSLLQALDKTKYAVLSLVCAICIKIVLAVFLTKSIGIYGFAISSVAMGAVALLGVNIAYLKICGMHLAKNVGVNLLLGVIIALCGAGIMAIVSNYIVRLCLGAIVCFGVYVWLAILFGVLSKADMQHLPFGRALKKMHRIIRFWEYDNEIGRSS